jgi:hypothetical protein
MDHIISDLIASFEDVAVQRDKLGLTAMVYTLGVFLSLTALSLLALSRIIMFRFLPKPMILGYRSCWWEFLHHAYHELPVEQARQLHWHIKVSTIAFLYDSAGLTYRKSIHLGSNEDGTPHISHSRFTGCQSYYVSALKHEKGYDDIIWQFEFVISKTVLSLANMAKLAKKLPRGQPRRPASELYAERMEDWEDHKDGFSINYSTTLKSDFVEGNNRAVKVYQVPKEGPVFEFVHGSGITVDGVPGVTFTHNMVFTLLSCNGFGVANKRAYIKLFVADGDKILYVSKPGISNSSIFTAIYPAWQAHMEAALAVDGKSVPTILGRMPTVLASFGYDLNKEVTSKKIKQGLLMYPSGWCNAAGNHKVPDDECDKIRSDIDGYINAFAKLANTNRGKSADQKMQIQEGDLPTFEIFTK